MELYECMILVVLCLAGLIFLVLQSEKKRKEQLKKTAIKIGFSFSSKKEDILLKSFENMTLFKRGHSHKLSNIIEGEMNRIKLTVFDYAYTVGAGQYSTRSVNVVACAQLEDKLPYFNLSQKSFFSKITDKFKDNDLNFDTNPIFSKKYNLNSLDENTTSDVFTPNILRFFENAKMKFHVESNRNNIIIYLEGEELTPKNIQPFILKASEIVKMFKKKY